MNDQYKDIPQRTMLAINRHVKDHIKVGGFVTACLRNDLQAAIGLADEENLSAIRQIVVYLYNEVPAVCWGSPDKVREWLAVPARQLNPT